MGLIPSHLLPAPWGLPSPLPSRAQGRVHTEPALSVHLTHKCRASRAHSVHLPKVLAPSPCFPEMAGMPSRQNVKKSSLELTMIPEL